MRRVHVVGAGLAGLSAALELADRGVAVTLHEAAPAAGGRCRSYLDRELGERIDNGNHLLLSGNRATFRFLRRVGSEGTLAGPGLPHFPFVDLETGERWVLRLNAGPVPWWALVPGRRVPGSRLAEYGQPLRLRGAPAAATVAERFPERGALYRRLIEPLAIAALNTMPEEGSAALLWAVMAETLARGGGACVPAFPAEGLSESFVTPALAALERAGAEVRFGSRVAGLTIAGGRVTALSGGVALGPDEGVVLAVPPWVAAELLPGLRVPEAHEAILNLHFAAEAPGTGRFVGLVGGLAEWVFVKPRVVSVTVSAANRYAGQEGEALAAAIWPEVVRALGLPGSPALPRFRVLREKRATFAATPAQAARRPGAQVAGIGNLALAGDWTATGLPATIEGAIRSGCVAADTVCGRSPSARERLVASRH